MMGGLLSVALINATFAFGNGLQAVGPILLAPYVYTFFFSDDFDPSEKVVARAKVGFLLLVAGYCLVNLVASFSLYRLFDRIISGG